ncbi:PD40 domain-containing protein [Paludibaculum fermentans]|uniref:PD40 domain-containing protein n=1 Tax=Paludibaculum fermentans TaxID=1473598 RepID=A0A7S7NWY3_PALFE|nr:PD40 domain-containing protein [Paludibaculum fermentans]QOY91322.1 PD40 domain-containing protein [Paludibaculum fermentans]
MQVTRPEASPDDGFNVRNAALEELQKILASDGFAKSERMRRFLSYAVEHSLAQDLGQLKESVIGGAVFDRPATYDPKADPIVRIEARRLREKLAAYYAGEGKDDPILINLPKGGYVTSIEAVRRTRSPSAPVMLDTKSGIPAPKRRNGSNSLQESRPETPDLPSPRPSSAPLPAQSTARSMITHRMIVLALVAVAVLIAAVWKIATSRPGPPPLEFHNFTSLPGAELQPAFSPDGTKVAFLWNGSESGRRNIYVQTVGSFTPVLLTKDAEGEVSSPVWSPGGREIAFLRPLGIDHLGIFVMDLATRDIVRRAVIESAPSPVGPSVLIDWSPDGKSIAATNRRDLVLISTSNGAITRITTSPERILGHYDPAFSPDGRTIAFREALSHGVDQLSLLDLASGRITRLTTGSRPLMGHAWTADGSALVFARQRSLWRIPAAGGEPRRLTDGTITARHPRIARAGGRLVFASPRQTIRVWRQPLPAGKSELVLSSTLTDVSPDIAPDGRRIAFRSDRSGTDEIWVSDIHGTAPRRLTQFGRTLTGCPRWSPDGHSLALDSRTGDNSDIFIVNVDNGKLRRFTSENYDEVVPSWSRDGRTIYYSANTNGTWQIWKRPFIGGTAVQVTQAGGFGAWESSDGRWIYYTKDRGGRAIWRLPVNGGTEETVFEGLDAGMWGNWRLHNDTIFFAGVQPPYSLRAFDLVTRRETILANLPNRPLVGDAGLAVAPDGASIFISLADPVASDLFLVEPFH